MNRSIRLSLSTRTLLCGGAGALGGWALARLPYHPLVLACRSLANLGGGLFSAWLRALAIPVILSSLVLGAVGLEPMRAVGKICLRTVGWMAATALAAALVGVGSAWALFPSRELTSRSIYSLPAMPQLFPLPATTWFWAELVLLGLGFAYYRNQLDEAQGRWITRLCSAVEGMASSLVDLTTRLLPWGVFAALLSAGTQRGPTNFRNESAFLAVIGSDEQSALLAWYAAKSLLLAWLIFGLGVLPLALWGLARVQPWCYLRLMLPPMLTALATGEVVETPPITLGFVRQRAHVSNRVASVCISLCGAFQREGLALGLTTLAACYWGLHSEAWTWHGAAAMVLAGWVTAVGTGALPLAANPALLFLCGMLGGGEDWPLRGWLLWAVVLRVGAALSVWSHVCAVAVIARSEGEFWVPGSPPDADELQRLKSDLESADG